jgi:antitoxin YobK
MTNIEQLIRQLEASGRDIFWQGQASDGSIKELESLVGSKLPASFTTFLARYGGGGVVGEEISGIEDDNPQLEYRGTVYGDTQRCREDHGLPSDLIVVYLGDDDIVWCLDASNFNGEECPVVSFNVNTTAKSTITTSFGDFLEEYLTLRLSR